MATATKLITALTPSGTNISGFPSHQGLDFVQDVQVWRGGVLLHPGASPGPGIDVVPGMTSLFGDIQLTANQPDLMPGERLLVRVGAETMFETIIPIIDYDFDTDDFTALLFAERDGKLIDNPTSATLIIRESENDPPIHTFPVSVSPNSRGAFEFTATLPALVRGKVYTFEMTVVAAGRTLRTLKGAKLL